ncbi:MAG: hypothetical protein ACRDHV_08290 [Actinomycetota bacterium]
MRSDAEEVSVTLEGSAALDDPMVLVHMRDRIEALGGTLDQDVGNGTAVIGGRIRLTEDEPVG